MNAAAAAAAELAEEVEAEEACFDEDVEPDEFITASAATVAAATAAADFEDLSLEDDVDDVDTDSAAVAEDPAPRDDPRLDEVGADDDPAPPLTPPIPSFEPSLPTMASSLDFFLRRVGSAAPEAGDLAPLALPPPPLSPDGAELPPALISKPVAEDDECVLEELSLAGKLLLVEAKALKQRENMSNAISYHMSSPSSTIVVIIVLILAPHIITTSIHLFSESTPASGEVGDHLLTQSHRLRQLFGRLQEFEMRFSQGWRGSVDGVRSG